MSIVLWEVPDLVMNQQATKKVDAETGELSVTFDGAGYSLGNIPLLFEHDGSSIKAANIWLIHLKLNLHKKSVNTQAQGLLHYFTFLNDIEMNWDEMPISARLRPTYRFRKHLREIYKSGVLARTTANSYIRVVINFYKFYLGREYSFDNPPFKYEVVKVNSSSSHEYMRSDYIYVDSTDLRLKLPNDTSYYGLSRELVPISNTEWEAVSKYYSVNKTGISKRNSGDVTVSIAEEFQLAVKLARYSGLRRSEIITLRMKAIYKPSSEQLKKKYLFHSNGLHLDPRIGIETKNGTVRMAEIPSKLMQELYDYINTSRYIERRKLYEKLNHEYSHNPPILINQKGEAYSSKTIDARWGEIRNAVRKEQPKFNHKFHNLRSTYAVERLKELLNSGIKEGSALDYLQSVMGHKNRSSLLAYLKFCEQEETANEVYESAINVVLESGD